MVNSYGSSCVILLTEKDTGSIVYSDFNGEIYTLGKIETLVLKQMLEGKTLETISDALQNYSQEDINDLINTFIKLNFFNAKKKKLIFKKFGLLEIRFFCPLFFIKNNKVLKIIRYELFIMSIPFLLFTIFQLSHKFTIIAHTIKISNYSVFLLKTIIICSIMTLLHETGHMIVALSFNYPILDVGVQIIGIIPIAYTKANLIKANTTKKILFYLGGICVNIQLAGFCTLLASIKALNFCYIIAGLNILITLVNLFPIKNSDGNKIIKLLLQ